MIPLVNALDECKGTMLANEIPCLLLLPVNTSEIPCNTLTTLIHTNSTLRFSQIMGEYTSYLCNNTFNLSDIGTHTFLYSTGDSGSVVIEQDTIQEVWFYVVVLIIFFILVGVGYGKDIAEFVMISGMLAMIIGISLFFTGFPNLTNDFLRNAIVAVICGIGAYLILEPAMDFFERWK